VDSGGVVRWQGLDAAIASGSNGAWIDDEHLMITIDPPMGQEVLHLSTGAGTATGSVHSIPIASLGRRVIRRASERLDEVPGLMTNDLDATNARPLIVTGQPASILTVHHARSVP
jgi:hypothetical protein